MYLDDFFFSTSFTISKKKPMFVPSKTAKFLGYSVRSESLQLFLPGDKLFEIKKEFQSLITRQSVKALTSPLSGENGCSKGSNQLFHGKFKVPSENFRHRNPRATKVIHVPSDFSWWIESIQARNGRAIQFLTPDQIIQTDTFLPVVLRSAGLCKRVTLVGSRPNVAH